MKPLTSKEEAQVIMGKNFFGIEEAIKCFGISPSPKQLAILKKVPWSKETLCECKDTHILVAVFPLSKSCVLKSGSRFFREHHLKNKMFNNCNKKVSWHLILKCPVPDSTDKDWKEQTSLLKQTEKVPELKIILYVMLESFLVTGKWLFEDMYCRCLDKISGKHLSIGAFDEGLTFADWPDKHHYFSIGICSSRK